MKKLFRSGGVTPARHTFNACDSLWIAITCGVLLTAATGAAVQGNGYGPNGKNFDVRATPQKAPAAVSAKILNNSKAAAVQKELLAGKSDLASRLPHVEVSVDETLGIASQISNAKGVLSQPTGKPEDTVKSFVANNHRLFGLGKAVDNQVKVRASYANPENKVQWVNLQQTVGGVPVFRGELRAALTEKGELSAITNEFAPGLTESVVKAPVALSPEDAIVAAAKDVGASADPSKLVRSNTSDDGNEIAFNNVDELSMLKVNQVIFPLAPGEAVLAWQVLIGVGDDAYLIVLDAADGSTLFRKYLVENQTQSATYLFYDGDSPAPGTPWPDAPVEDLAAPKVEPPVVPMTQKTLISEYVPGNPLGWINDYENTTRGNNVRAYRDQIGSGPIGDGIDQDPVNPQLLSYAYGDGNGPSLFNRNFRFQITPGPDGFDGPSSLIRNHTTYNDASVTNMFFWTNRYHDYLYRLGFTESAGNFQAENFGKGGQQGDPVLAEGLDYSGTNNANFTVTPDGTSGRMQMYVFPDMAPGYPFTNTIPARDSGLDQTVLIHELTHGTSNRLIANAAGLAHQQGRGLGEGWSDFYASSITSEFPAGKNQDPDGTYPGGGWIDKGSPGFNIDNYFYGARAFPYSTNRDYNPLTYADSDPLQYGTKDSATVVGESPSCLSEDGASVHNLGHIWATILWEARREIMKGFEEGGFASVAEAWKEGNRHMLQLVTDGLKLTPSAPTFVEARDSILKAALLQTSNPAGWVSNDSANPGIAAHDEARLWTGFAARGLGYKAVSPTRYDTTSTNREPDNYYTSKRGTGGAFFPAPLDADILKNLDDDDSVEIQLPGVLTFYGKPYNVMFVNTNGNVTFGFRVNGTLAYGAADDDAEISLKHHFELPRVSGLLTDLDGSTTAGTISVTDSASEVRVTYRNMPESGIEPGEDNTNSFQIRVTVDSLDGEPGQIQLYYGTCTAEQAIVGLSPGPKSLAGPYYDLDECVCNVPNVDEDLSALTHCNPEYSGMYFTEFFEGPEDDLFDLENMNFRFFVNLVEGWENSPVESYETPLQPRAAKYSVGGETKETVQPGDIVEIRIPLENQLKKANLTNVLGLITPISEGVDIIDPVSDYGRIDSGDANEGLDPFIIKIADDVPCGAQIQLKVDYTSDQGLKGATRSLFLTVGGGFGDVQGNLEWPQSPSSGVVGSPVDADALQLTLASQQNMRSGTNLKNSRTGEIIQVTSFNRNSLVISIKRGQKGTTKAAMQNGDNLAFDSTPIPDATGAGVALQVVPPPGSPISGPVGRVKVKLGKLTHPNIGDIRLTLSNAQGVSVVLMENAKAGLGQSSVFSDITFDTSASLSIQSNNGIQSGGTYRPVQDFSAFQHADFNAATTWTLTVADIKAPFLGDVSAWSVEFTPYIYCETPAIASSTFEVGATGWSSSSYGTAGTQSAYLKPAAGNAPATLVLHTEADATVRVPRWTAPGVELSKFPNQVYRFNAWVARSGQQVGNQSQIPALRIQAGINDVMLNMRNYLFDTTQVDPGLNAVAMGMAPSTNISTPTHYWVDFDPVDVPSLYSNPDHRVNGFVENLSFQPNHQGNFEIVETRMDRYSAPSEDEATGVWSFSRLGFENVWSENHANTNTRSDLPYQRPKVTTNSLGVTIDSSRVRAAGPIAFATSDVKLDAPEVIMQPGHLYRVRYHLVSNTPAASNPIMRLRARSVNFADSNELILGPSNFGQEKDQLLGQEALPGLGTKNPTRRGDEQQGGYYDQFISAPPIAGTNPALLKLRFGFDLFDLGYDGNGTAAQNAEGGRFTLDSIEVREYRQR